MIFLLAAVIITDTGAIAQDKQERKTEAEREREQVKKREKKKRE